MMQHYDIVIIGAGPGGLAAAMSASEAKCSVLVVDDNPLPGGQIWRHRVFSQLPVVAHKWINGVFESKFVTVSSQTKVVMFPQDKQVLLESPDSAKVVSFDKLILATGARELFLPYPGWELPGITGAGGLQSLIKGGLPVKGQRIVIAGSGPLLLAAADSARKAGAHVVAIVEQASMKSVAKFSVNLVRWPIKAIQSISLIPKRYWTSSYIQSVSQSNKGFEVAINKAGRIRHIECDRVACGFGLMPNIELPLALGCEVNQGCVVTDSFQRTSAKDYYAVGEVTGIGGSELALLEGQIAGYHASGNPKPANALLKQQAKWQAFADLLKKTFELGSSLLQLAKDNTLVCRCEDVTFERVKQYANWREAKVATRCGMGACQGRICSGAAQTLFKWQPPVPRPPFTPTRIETLSLIGSGDK
ncbi:NAD(P)/FAD-dependent oxidoreductase [Vibrio ziniensis]|uniref:NAD(P)/FAD-dependent oxidoreductase n=1 Tax=Vibrio ziniensis TaxID=2711221 RepID=A0A6G7CJ28_9VIBR|nr:FAD/NAD(P)-binding oxidoreductase [Vibrio ziniensis]QIH42084.1 NAD(P)/FAD-dependent oxidoreductase [Vibrio ziniensis]